jgi:D-glycero-D-manno-heptose 1,7-bisphosphate phosphatase
MIHDEMNRQLRDGGANLDGIYFCTVPRGPGDRTVIEHPDRKPAPGMLLRAAKELKLDLPRSWMVGDAVSDVLAGKNAGCRGMVLIGPPAGPEARELKNLAEFHVAADLSSAFDWILSQD